jgi:ABC-type antimicrobial peptide transport system permease subunit
MALGATRQGVAQLALGELVSVLAIGIAVGAGLAWLGARSAQAALGQLLYGLRATDWLTLAAAVVVLAAAALLAGWLPARRAARADPCSSLREE